MLSRTGELSTATQIRKAFNNKTMSKAKWDANPDTYKYQLAAPFTGGAFDVFVEIYQRDLVRRRAIPKSLAEDSYDALGEDILDLQPAFAKHFRKKEGAFEAALLSARDEFAKLLARTWARTSMYDLTYPRVIDEMIAADLELHRGRNIAIIRDSFYWREILPKKGR